jgi:hypothetical protein
MSRARFAAVVLVGGLALLACSDAKRSPSVVGMGGSTDSRPPLAHNGGEQAAAGDSAGGADATNAGQGGSGHAGEGPVATAGEGGSATAGSTALGGAGPDPIPPVGDPPICAHGLKFASGTRLGMSAEGDDVLQSITPDELTIAWKNADHFYVADRDDVSDAFSTAVEVANGEQYVSVTLSSDGLQLIGVKQDLAVVEQTRTAGAAFDDDEPGPGEFFAFNATRATIPVANQVLADAVLGADDASFFFSHFTTSHTGDYATLFESRRVAGSWPFAAADLGARLYASDQKRRIPTGVSSDSLTLFYADEVAGDFRAAWRVNTQVPFDHSEVLDLGPGARAAAPGSSCSRIYYSALGSNGLDLFVAEASP